MILVGAPSPSDIEVAVIGPGYGECCVVHLGGGNWVIVDSCIDSGSGVPAAISYFERIDVDISSAVRLIVGTHYHDDHIKGIAEVFRKSASAQLCLPAAMDSREFTCRVEAYSEIVLGPTGSVTKEIKDLIQNANLRTKAGGPAIKRAVAERTIFELSSANSGHGYPCDIKCLSPSDAEFDRAIENLAKSYALAMETKKRPLPSAQNDFSIVLSIRIGDFSILLGSDLERSSDAKRGWIAAVSSKGVDYVPAVLLKVPHHGGFSGHSEEMWKHLVIPGPIAALTPWQNGRNHLPTITDVARIRSKTSTAYCSAKPRKSRSSIYRKSPVKRTIRESGIKIRPAESTTGIVRMRCSASTGVTPGNWTVDLINGAHAL